MNPSEEDGLAAVIHALRWVAIHGDLDIAQACIAVMKKDYPHLRKKAWDQLNYDEQESLKVLMT